MNDFEEFPKIPRFNRDIVISEKIDGTNAQVFIGEDSSIRAGSRGRWITPENDNYGFAAWVERNKSELLKLGPGRHFGEWFGAGIQRRYELPEKRFALFNSGRWLPDAEVESAELWGKDLNATGGRAGVIERDTRREGPRCCYVVPVLYSGPFSEIAIQCALDRLRSEGSHAAPGFMQPEGVVIYHTAARQLFKVTLENDDRPKSNSPAIITPAEARRVES